MRRWRATWADCAAASLAAALLGGAPAAAQDKPAGAKPKPAATQQKPAGAPPRQIQLDNKPWKGDFDGMSAYQLLHVLKNHSRTCKRILINTGSLKRPPVWEKCLSRESGIPEPSTLRFALHRAKGGRVHFLWIDGRLSLLVG